MSELWFFPPAWREAAPEVAVVLGSGLGDFAARLESPRTLSYEEVPGLPASRVPGHAGRFVLGTLGRTRLLVAQGRAHLYEGRSAAEATAGVRAMASLGIKTLILTNAAGTVNPAFKAGGWMQITDHLNLTGASPLTGGPHFLDQTEVYDRRLRVHFSLVAQDLGHPLEKGVYAGLPGPQYETPAEVRMLRVLGADAVGMSTVLEATQARALGLRVAGFSCLTNPGAGLSGEPLNHTDVLAACQRAAGQLADLLEAALPLPASVPG